MTMTRTKSHSGNCWIEEIKNKKKKTSDAVRGVTEDNPLTPFKGIWKTPSTFIIDSLGTKI